MNVYDGCAAAVSAGTSQTPDCAWTQVIDACKGWVTMIDGASMLSNAGWLPISQAIGSRNVASQSCSQGLEGPFRNA